MTSGNADESSVERLELPLLAPDPERMRRVRARCHAQLHRSRRRVERTALVSRFAHRVLAPAVIGGVCLLYVAALVATTLRLEDLFR